MANDRPAHHRKPAVMKPSCGGGQDRQASELQTACLRWEGRVCVCVCVCVCTVLGLPAA